MVNGFFVLERSGTRYEVCVSFNDNLESEYYGRYVISLINFGECFHVGDLNKVAEVIYDKSNIFSLIDAINIHNCISENFDDILNARIGQENYAFVEYCQ